VFSGFLELPWTSLESGPTGIEVFPQTRAVIRFLFSDFRKYPQKYPQMMRGAQNTTPALFHSFCIASCFQVRKTPGRLALPLSMDFLIVF